MTALSVHAPNKFTRAMDAAHKRTDGLKRGDAVAVVLAGSPATGERARVVEGSNWKYCPGTERSGRVMLVSIRRSTPRTIILSTTALICVLITQPATAATVSYQGMCGRTSDIEQWTPQKGAIARFVADTFANSSQTGLWIGLGRVGTSFWSAEGGDPNDACDDCRSLFLVETRADGTRKSHTVLDSADDARIGSDVAARKAIVLARLWKLASNTWPVDKLTQDYALTVGKPAANAPDEDPPFTVKVNAKGVFGLRYSLGAKTSMCWCFYDWKVTQ